VRYLSCELPVGHVAHVTQTRPFIQATHVAHCGQAGHVFPVGQAGHIAPSAHVFHCIPCAQSVPIYFIHNPAKSDACGEGISVSVITIAIYSLVGSDAILKLLPRLSEAYLIYR